MSTKKIMIIDYDQHLLMGLGARLKASGYGVVSSMDAVSAIAVARKEMPDLQALYERFGPQGLVILGISDEEASKVDPFIRDRKITFPVLLDPGHKVNEMFIVEGIPKSFVYDRDGKLVSQSIDMRTRNQFLEMLSKAGLQ